MATVYRTQPGYNRVRDLWRDQGETEIVNGELYVRMSTQALYRMDESWRYSKAEADASVIPALLEEIRRIQAVIDEIRPAPAAADVSPSAGAAQAAVAT